MRRGRPNKFKHSTWVCVCDCGSETTPETLKLRSGHTTSCGCLARELHGKIQLSHGGCIGGISAEYSVWRGMISRCNSPANRTYANYGGRGIKVCERWLKFENFLADMGKRPDGTTLDRENNDGDYEPGNCRWATAAQQNRNKRSNIWVHLDDGTKVVLKDYAAMHGIDYHCIYARYTRGQPLLKPSEIVRV
jgi:hypothetical protein